MYKVLVVEDETPALEIIKDMIDWSQTNFSIVATAKNGKEGYEKYIQHAPDLVITDIQMPIMDGLEMIQKIRETGKRQEIAILSCHENFYFAKKAMQLKVEDYLIKDLMTEKDIYSLLLKVEKSLIHKQSDAIELFQIDRKQNLEDFKDIYQQAAIKAIFLNENTFEKNLNYITNLGLSLIGEEYVMLVVDADIEYLISDAAKLEPSFISTKVESVINAVLREHQNGICYTFSENRWAILIAIDTMNSELKYISICREYAQAIQFSLWSQHKISVTIAISESIHRLEHLMDKYQKTHLMIQYKMFLGKGKIIFYHDLINNVAKTNLNVSDLRLKNIEISIENKAVNTLKKEINQIYCQDIKGIMQYNYIDYMNMFLIRKIIELCEGHRIEYRQIFDLDYIPFVQLKSLETVEDIAKWFMDIFEKILTFISPTQKYSRKVQDALQYIKINYGDSQLCLTQIAEDCGTNKVYLSRIFKSETGENLTDYIQNYRIEKAKKLIHDTNYKLYQVAEAVGLQNASQFSVVFKKITGMSPQQYKSNQ